MEKKLPGVFQNKIEKVIKNNESVYYGKDEEKDEKKIIKDKQEIKNDKKNINQKINDIFSSVRYVYKADVVITLKDGEVTKKVIGRNAVNLITIDNELIPISEILDIRFVD